MTARVVAPLLLLTLVVSGCSQAGDMLDQARGLQEQVENIRWCSDVVRLATAVDTANAEAARNLVDVLERTAPEDLAEDVEVVRAAVREVEAGAIEAKDLARDDVRAAVQRLVDAVNERCDGELNAELGNN